MRRRGVAWKNKTLSSDASIAYVKAKVRGLARPPCEYIKTSSHLGRTRLTPRLDPLGVASTRYLHTRSRRALRAKWSDGSQDTGWLPVFESAFAALVCSILVVLTWLRDSNPQWRQDTKLSQIVSTEPSPQPCPRWGAPWSGLELPILD